jgi:hypothetical protein
MYQSVSSTRKDGKSNLDRRFLVCVNRALRPGRIGHPEINDSDEFLQDSIRARGPERDYSQKIESLVKRMTVKEKVGQMTQLTLQMIVSGHDQSIQINPAKLQKAIGQ